MEFMLTFSRGFPAVLNSAVVKPFGDIKLSAEYCPHRFNEPKAFVELEIH